MVNMNRILLAEDNDDLRELITDFLSEHGFDVYAAVDGEDAWEAVQTTRYQLVLLDVMMPGMDGFTLCRKIRERESVPVLFLTARVLEEDQLRGYELGADDYILKPFSLRVLLAKCQAVLERYQCGMQAEQQKGLWKNEKRQQFFCDGQPVELQSLDFRLLSYFYENPNRILTREQIILKLWGYEYGGNDRSVDTHVKNLRKALGDYGSCIRTIVKKGYIFERNKMVKEQTGEGQEG
jgi:two-component system, OmpR family, response regulator